MAKEKISEKSYKIREFHIFQFYIFKMNHQLKNIK